jgi:hypothetical protein
MTQPKHDFKVPEHTLRAEAREMHMAKVAEDRKKWIKKEKIENHHMKDDLIGKIYTIYSKRGEDVPFGLGSKDMESLKKHYERLSSQWVL